jgi:hypothetical protein
MTAAAIRWRCRQTLLSPRPGAALHQAKDLRAICPFTIKLCRAAMNRVIGATVCD